MVVGCLLFGCRWSAGGPCNVMLGSFLLGIRFFFVCLFSFGGRLFGGAWV